MNVAILIPCLNEQAALPSVLGEIPPGFRVVLCDNGSTDRSVAIAEAHGAEIASEPRRGYGGAVKAGIAHLRDNPPDVVVILDADHSTYIEDLAVILAPIEAGTADMVLSERITHADPGALTRPQRFGNRLATVLIELRTGHRYRDMGPFRAIRWDALQRLRMIDPTWGWNVEMQIKAAKLGLRILEVPVRYRTRIGTSKISGTVRGVARAGYRIVWACWHYG